MLDLICLMFLGGGGVGWGYAWGSTDVKVLYVCMDISSLDEV